MDKELINEGEKLSIEEESNLFFKAQKACRADLLLIETNTTGIISDIAKVHRMFLEDPNVINETVELIEKGHSRGYSYSQVVDKYILYLSNNKDAYLSKRVDDFKDIKYRMLMRMYKRKIEKTYTKDTILVVETLYPSLVLNAHPKVKGIISSKGSHLTHAAILTKEKGISYVVSNKTFKNDTFVLLDSDNNQIIENPSKDALKVIKENNLNSLKQTYHKTGFKLFLNVSSNNPVHKQITPYIDGIGLFRTEHLILSYEIYPTLDKQTTAYKSILKQMYPKPVKVRLFDFAGDKNVYFLEGNHVNQFQYFGLLNEVYEDQLKALLLANESFGNLEIMIPMIRDVKEYNYVKQAIETLHKTLKLKKPQPKLGIMVETKEVYHNLALYKDVDFMSIGTNDLSQDLLNIKRRNINYQDTIDEMLKAIKTIHAFAHENDIDYSICGDLASHQSSLQLLIEAGERHFSMPETFIKDALDIIDTYLKNE